MSSSASSPSEHSIKGSISRGLRGIKYGKQRIGLLLTLKGSAGRLLFAFLFRRHFLTEIKQNYSARYNRKKWAPMVDSWYVAVYSANSGRGNIGSWRVCMLLLILATCQPSL
jgi:hypothetical protein